ncbi:MAG TPA: ribose-phosphate pyrophosphokinase [Salegentibacter sp.]|uniref:ribose-phosphate diphosphokinase n=1 Tax=Salegentibacter sp. TaxID=1903072 RepID=UPI002F945830
MLVFALENSREFGEKIAGELDIALSDHEEREFEDGEHKSRPLVNVRNQDVFIIQSLHGGRQGSVNDMLCRLLFFVAAVKDASAKSISVVVPYLCYARKDRRTKARDPVTIRYVAQLFEAVGIDRIVNIDVHNLQAFQNAFRCITEHLEAKNIFAGYFLEKFRDKEIAVMSPDFGGVKRADDFRKILEKHSGKSLPLIIMEKMRSKGVISGDAIVGDVKGKNVIIIDDLIASGSTMLRAAKACLNLGADAVYAVATHASFSSRAGEILSDDAIREIVISDSIPLKLPHSKLQQKIKVLSVAPLFAEAIKRIHAGGSLVDLLKDE